MMNKIFLIRDLQDNPISTYKKTWCYKTLGIAKAAAKNYIKNKNKHLPKAKKLSYDSIKVIECDLVRMEEHPI
jgi:hypothetical protein